MRPSFSTRTAALLILSLGSIFPCRVQAQEEVIPILRGQVRVGDAPLSSGFVVLHQVSAEASGEVDSVRVDPDGTFQLRLPHVPDHLNQPEIFFASVQYRGLLYFGEAVTDAIQLDSLYLIQAYDTLSVPSGGVQLPLSARNIFLEKRENGWAATDVLQFSQEGDRTLFSPEERVVWAYPLPETATDIQVDQADMAPDAIRFAENRMEVYSPLPPGERYLVLRYDLPQDDFIVPLPGRTDRMEILVREPAPAAEFYPLSLSDPVEIEPGNVFRRYAAEDLLDVDIHSEVAPEPWSVPAEWMGLLLAGLLGAAGVFGYRRRQDPRSIAGPGPEDAAYPGPTGSPEKVGSTYDPFPRPDAPPPKETSREKLLAAIATLDEAFQARQEHPPSAQADYETKRRELLSLLKQLR